MNTKKISKLKKLANMKHLAIIRNDNKSIIYWESKFDRNIGEVITFNNSKWRVIHTGEKKSDVGHYIHIFGSRLFDLHKY